MSLTFVIKVTTAWNGHEHARAIRVTATDRATAYKDEETVPAEADDLQSRLANIKREMEVRYAACVSVFGPESLNTPAKAKTTA